MLIIEVEFRLIYH